MQEHLLFGAGSLHRIPTTRQRQRVLAAAYDVGIRAFDVAPAYGNGINEVEVGVALRGSRDGCEINTKYGIQVPIYGALARHAFALWRVADRLTGASAGAYRRRDFSPAELERSLDRSLNRLRTDHVDTLFVHEPVLPLGVSQVQDIVDCAERMKLKGKVRAIGIAGPATALVLCPSLAGFDVVQTRCVDLQEPQVVASGKPVIAYGAYRAYRAAHTGGTFTEFLAWTVLARPGTRVIVASTSLRTIRSFGGPLR
jgi:aryl-alcohol dehydrogenase-like predicted oxidoreductase